jgi:hypothetical protein
VALQTVIWGSYDWPAGSGTPVCTFRLTYDDATNDVQTITVRNEHDSLWGWGEATVEARDRVYAFYFAPLTEVVIPVPQSVSARLRFTIRPGGKRDSVQLSSGFPVDPPAEAPPYPNGSTVTPL